MSVTLHQIRYKSTYSPRDNLLCFISPETLDFVILRIESVFILIIESCTGFFVYPKTLCLAHYHIGRAPHAYTFREWG